MKAFRTFQKFAFPIVIVALFSACSDKRDLYREESAPNPVITIDSTIVVTKGDYASSTIEKVREFAPTSITMDAKVERTGNRYILKIKVSAEGPEPHFWGNNWYADRDDGREELVYQGGFVTHTNSFEITSSELDANRLYRFDITAHVWTTNSSNQMIEGEVTYKKITVDLRGLER